MRSTKQNIIFSEDETMKKILSLLLVGVIALSFVACGGNNNDSKTDTTAKQMLSAVWADLAEDEKYYVSGGDSENAVEGDAGDVKDVEYMTYNLLLSEELQAQIDDAASLIHGMNANSLTLGMYHMVNNADEKDFADAMREAINGNRWMCGFPEKMFIATVDGFVLVGYGLSDNIDSIATHFSKVYSGATVLYNEEIVA